MSLSPSESFAVWITGLPASGKSTLAHALKSQLRARGLQVAILESDRLREVFTPEPDYSEQERAHFYRQMAFVGALLVDHGVAVIFDATANRNAYRDQARRQIARFLEVFVDTPLEVCVERDPKGIYQLALQGSANHVPGLQVPYEPPASPDLIIAGDRETPDQAAERIVSALQAKGYL